MLANLSGKRLSTFHIKEFPLPANNDENKTTDIVEYSEEASDFHET